MKILLIGNYENLRQQSIQRFADMLLTGLSDAGHEVRLVRPPAWLGCIWRGETGLAKWIGYVDRFLLYPPLLRRQARWADVVHICVDPIYIPATRRVPAVFTCHDVLPIRAALGEIPECTVSWTGRLYQEWSLRCLKRAQQVVCVSNQTRFEAARLLDSHECCLTVVPNALNYPYRPLLTEEINTHLGTLDLGRSETFFLHVGGNEWYKNRLGVMRLFSEVIKHPMYQEHLLVMAGKPWTDEMRRLAASLCIQDRVLERVGVSNEQLRALYSRAEALLFPSLAEGFGWPIVEAQACGCPVVTTNRPPMTEVGGQAAIYIDSIDPVGGAQRVIGALEDREHWRTAGLENVERYSSPTMISGYVTCYENVLRKHQAERNPSCVA